jgi:hypothetical protein
MTTTQPTIPQPKTSHVSGATRAIISTIAALVLLGAVILVFIWYRRRYNTIGGSSEFSSGVMEAGSRVEVTPFVSSHHEIAQRDSMTGTGWHQPQSGLPATVVTNADTHDPYSSPSGLHPQLPASVPVGLSDKELARIRAENLRSQSAIHTIAVSLPGDASGSQSPSLPATATEQRGSPTSQPLFRTLQSQVDRLWREMRQLRAERLGSEAPPSYAEHDVSHHGGGGQS